MPTSEILRSLPEWPDSVDAVMASIRDTERRCRQSFEYLGDPDELVARRGSLSAVRVA
jgi:hypothetical protein